MSVNNSNPGYGRDFFSWQYVLRLPQSELCVNTISDAKSPMPYAKYDDNRIIAISLTEAEDYEWVDANDPALLVFQTHMMAMSGADSAVMRSSDFDLIRVLEDLINLLIEKNTIHFTDLPEAAQKKLINRKGLRDSGNSLDLLGDEGLI